jgi:hypothetical protein
MSASVLRENFMGRKIEPSGPDHSSADTKGKLKRAAVSKRHPMFGAMKGLVRIAPGTDLTKPADPNWSQGGDT